MNPIHLFFHWPEGGVWSNIIASIIWGAAALLLGRWKLNKMHRESKAQHEAHMATLVDLHTKHHQEVLKEIRKRK